MTNELLELLSKTTGIIRTSKGILSKKIDPAEYPDLLSMKTVKFDITVGQWVKIKKGNYKGDVGRVMELHAWGVDVYLVPRKTHRNNDNSRKRKASRVVPEPELFFPTAEDIAYSDGSIKSGQHIFAHGLTIKTFDYHSIDPQVSDISLKLYDLFLGSEHPDIPLSSLPRPREWVFTEGENVVVHPFNKKGSINSIEAGYAEVDTYGEGLHCEPWHKITKSFTIGDFVHVTGGPNLNSNGWIIDINGVIATIASKVMEGEIKYDFASAIDVSSCRISHFILTIFFFCQTIDVHSNLLVATSVPFQNAAEAQPTSLPFQLVKHHKHAWCGTEIIVVKRGSALKGRTGKVTCVLYGQPTATGLKLAIQLTQYDPSIPFHTLVLDYDDVYETTCVKSYCLFQLFKPKKNYRSFRKLQDYFGSEDGRPLVGPPPQQTPNRVAGIGGATPMPTETSSTSPAWDPSSRTPSHDPAYSMPSTSVVSRHSISQVDQPAAGSSQPQIQHLFLNPLLVGKKLNAIVNGGEHKQKSLEVSISVLQERILMDHTKYGTSYRLQPEWVTPKHPSPTHDNGLLIVIKGDHCSKYVRRIHHRHNDAGCTIVLAVTQRVEKAADTITDERLELAPEYLCTVSETKAEKDLNKELMKSLRMSYRSSTLR
jgi:hypothetical protein